MASETPPFRNQALSAEQLENAVLLSLAIASGRNDPNLEHGRRWEGAKLNIRQLAREAGWQVMDADVDAAVRSLTHQGLLSTNRDPTAPGTDGCWAELKLEGYARAVESAPHLLGSRFPFRQSDPVFDGIGEVEIEFLGERLVVGCEDGKEADTIRRAHRLEIDTGEVMKAVTGDLDNRRAVLMAGLLAIEHIEELEAGAATTPAADRVVPVNHNTPEYAAAMAAIDQVVDAIRKSNHYRETDPDDQERRLAEIEAGKRLLIGKFVSLTAIKATLLAALSYLVMKFIDVPIGELAEIAWRAVQALLGLP